jgi:hypothetical protein
MDVEMLENAVRQEGESAAEDIKEYSPLEQHRWMFAPHEDDNNGYPLRATCYLCTRDNPTLPPNSVRTQMEAAIDMGQRQLHAMAAIVEEVYCIYNAYILPETQEVWSRQQIAEHLQTHRVYPMLTLSDSILTQQGVRREVLKRLLVDKEVNSDALAKMCQCDDRIEKTLTRLNVFLKSKK